MENVQRSRGRPQNYKFDRGGMPAEMGPYIGIVVNNVDNARSGRLQVYIEEFGATETDGTANLTDTSLWVTVNYCPPFYGATPVTESSEDGVGTYPGNRNSYGMWFTPPDIGVKVLCFFVGGDHTQGYYVGCIPEIGITHMIPAVGAASKFELGQGSDAGALGSASQLPVTEINSQNPDIAANPRFFDQERPVQRVVASALMQQGLNQDTVRGTIRSSSQRESPSAVFGFSTPGRPVYQGTVNDAGFRDRVARDEVKLQDIAVIGRQGGHSLVLDDGDIEGTDNLIRIRSSRGHQITMSDDNECFYFVHANGQTWLEFGKEGTVDVFSTNSVNVRTQGQLNLHADQGINIYSGTTIKIKSQETTTLESNASLQLTGKKDLTLFSPATVGIRSDGALALASKSGGWKGGSSLNFEGGVINLNGASSPAVTAPTSLSGYKLTDTVFSADQGWTASANSLETIVTRAPTHEPYPYHNQGVAVSTNLDKPTAETVSEVPDAPKAAAVQATLAQVAATPVVAGVTPEQVLKEPAAAVSIGGVSLPPAAVGLAQSAGAAATNLTQAVTAASAGLTQAASALTQTASSLTQAASAAQAGLAQAAGAAQAGLAQATAAAGGLLQQANTALTQASAAAGGLLQQANTVANDALGQISALRTQAVGALEQATSAASGLARTATQALGNLGNLSSINLANVINPQQVTALTAQAKAAASGALGNLLPSNLASLLPSNLASSPFAQLQSAGQSLYQVGVGLYNQTASTLELSGFLKPSARFIDATPERLAEALNSPAVWTGQGGINSLADYLANEELQNTVQIQTMQGAFQGLVDAGLLSGKEPIAEQAALVQAAAQYGVDAVDAWVDNRAPPDLSAALTIAARQGQYAVALVESDPLLIEPPALQGFENVTVRGQLDQSITAVINEARIPAVEFGGVPAATAAVDEQQPNPFAPRDTDLEGTAQQLAGTDSGTFRLAPGRRSG
jgi:hypothetical protein